MAISSTAFPSPSASWRAARSQVLKAEADYGYCAAKREYYYGLKAHLLIDWRGVAVGITVTAANIDEREAAYDVLRAIEGLVLGDKGRGGPRRLDRDRDLVSEIFWLKILEREGAEDDQKKETQSLLGLQGEGRSGSREG
jgi:hypothetical protein